MSGKLLGGQALAPGTQLEVDAVIVGSGAGGAAVAAELTRAGMSVAVLEQGRSFATGEVIAKPSWAFANLYLDQGPLVAKGRIMTPLAAGSAVGGSTFVNSAICFRAPDDVLAERTRDFGSPWTRERLEPLFIEIENALEVAKTTPELARNNSLVFKRGADKLGLRGDFISRNAPGCVGCGVCQLGCPIGGKGSVDKNLLPQAIERGASVYSEVRARDPQGTARLSADPKRGVCKPSGETWDVERLFVADGSLFPSALGVNPQITILAMATGIARDVVKRG